MFFFKKNTVWFITLGLFILAAHNIIDTITILEMMIIYYILLF